MTDTLTTADILRQARAKIADPERWTKGANARTVNDEVVNSDDPLAVKFCALGALGSVLGASSVGTPGYTALMHQVPSGQLGMVSFFNDAETTSHADILALFDRAIEAAYSVESMLDFANNADYDVRTPA